jgi:hypothetical protein
VLAIGKGDSDKGSSLHDPRQRVPHETQELRAINITVNGLFLGRNGKNSHLKESVLLLRLELVGTKEFQTTLGLFRRKTVIVTLKQFEDIVDNDGLQINLFLVVEVLCLQLDLHRDQYAYTGVN